MISLKGDADACLAAVADDDQNLPFWGKIQNDYHYEAQRNGLAYKVEVPQLCHSARA